MESSKPGIARERARRASLAMAIAALAAMLPGDGAAAELRIDVGDGEGRPLANAVISIVPTGANGLPLPAMAPAGTLGTIDQRDMRFAPEVIAVQRGTAVTFPNSDDVRHHVYSFSRPNDFQIKLYHGEPSAPVTFAHAGVVTLGCNIHDGMVGFIAVVESPWFAVSDTAGRAAIDAPPGAYEMRSWHPDLGARDRRYPIVLGRDGAVTGVRLVGATGGVIGAPAAANPLQALFGDD